jgi:hypothetical protein
MPSSPGRRWQASKPLEGARKGRFGFVPNLHRNCSHGSIAVSQEACGNLHTPIRKVLHGRLANESDKALMQA